MVLAANREPTKGMKPSEKPFHPPTLSVEPERACVLGEGATRLAVRLGRFVADMRAGPERAERSMPACSDRLLQVFHKKQV